MTALDDEPDARRRPRLSAPRIAEVVAGELRQQIIDGDLADGDFLPRQDLLVERFNVGLVSLREALRILETEGLISVRRGNRGGAVVHAPAKASAAYMLGLMLQSESVYLSDLGAALHELEPTCAALAAARPDRATSSVPELRRINAAMSDQISDGSAFTEIGRQFHNQIVLGCGNQTIIAVVGSLESLWTSHEQQWAEDADARGGYPSLKDRRAVLHTHTRLTDMIEVGDAGRARRMSAKHLTGVHTYVLSRESDHRIWATQPQTLSRTRGLQ